MTYRGGGDAWIAKREALVRALASEGDRDRYDEIARELAALDRTRREEARRRLPLVASARIASPCHEVFEAMTGEGALRTCARCDQEVFDLAQMTLAQAESLIVSRAGSVCTRLRRRQDGTLMFADCEVGARGVRARKVGALVAAVTVAGTALAWIATPPGAPSAAHIRAVARTTSASRSVPGVPFVLGERPPHEPGSPLYALGGPVFVR